MLQLPKMTAGKDSQLIHALEPVSSCREEEPEAEQGPRRLQDGGVWPTEQRPWGAG